jgi:hypothetical protein
VLDAEGKALVGFTAASDGDGAVHELLDWRFSALESATQGRTARDTARAPQQERLAAGTAGTGRIISTVSAYGGSE